MFWDRIFVIAMAKKKFFNKMSQIDIILGEKIIENIEIFYDTHSKLALNKLFSDKVYTYVVYGEKFRNWSIETIFRHWQIVLSKI